MAIENVKLDELKPNPYQPIERLEISEDTASQFGNSILNHGLIQTPIGRRNNGFVEIGDGWLRYHGFQWLRKQGYIMYATMPVEIRELTNQQMADLVMEANTVRHDLSAIAEAEFYKRYINDFGVTQTDLAERHNCSQGEIANTLRLLELPQDIQEKISAKEITGGHGRILLRINILPELQRERAERAAAEKWSVNELDNSIDDILARSSKPLSKDDWPAPIFDLEGCKGCKFRMNLTGRYRDGKKFPHCINTSCWDDKQKTEQESRDAQIQQQLKRKLKKAAKSGAHNQMLKHDALRHDQYETLEGGYSSRTYKEILAEPEQCESCEKRALMEGYGSGSKPSTVCLDTKCYRSKQVRHTKEENKTKKIKDQALTDEISRVCKDPKLNSALALRIIARLTLPLTRNEAKQDLVKIFELPTTEKGKVMLDSWYKELDKIQEDDLLRLILATMLCKYRRDDYYDKYSVKMPDSIKRQWAQLKGAEKDFLNDVIAFEKGNCKGCARALKELMGTGENCCNVHWGKRLDSHGKCANREPEKEAESVPA